MNDSLNSKTALRRAGCVLAAGAGLTSAPAQIPPDPPQPVILVHGIWDTTGTLRKMERVLREAGFCPIVITLTPNNGRAGLDALACEMQRQVESQVDPGARVSIVGFSMGGLVARSWLRQFAAPGRVATFVTIASPHRGTWLAWCQRHPGVRDMRPGSEFLAAIDADAPRHAGTRWITIRTPLDLIIVPSSSSELEWAENHSVPVLAHPLLVLDRTVIHLVLDGLGAELSTKPARAGQASPHAGSPPR